MIGWFGCSLEANQTAVIVAGRPNYFAITGHTDIRTWNDRVLGTGNLQPSC